MLYEAQLAPFPNIPNPDSSKILNFLTLKNR